MEMWWSKIRGIGQLWNNLPIEIRSIRFGKVRRRQLCCKIIRWCLFSFLFWTMGSKRRNCWQHTSAMISWKKFTVKDFVALDTWMDTKFCLRSCPSVRVTPSFPLLDIGVMAPFLFTRNKYDWCFWQVKWWPNSKKARWSLLLLLKICSIHTLTHTGQTNSRDDCCGLSWIKVKRFSFMLIWLSLQWENYFGVVCTPMVFSPLKVQMILAVSHVLTPPLHSNKKMRLFSFANNFYVQRLLN